MAESSDTTEEKENETWSSVVGRNRTKETIFPIFIIERDILSKEECIKNPVREAEVYHSLIQEAHPIHLRSVQRVGALWRIYLHDKGARAKLLIKGISIRGKHINLKEENPFSLKSRMANQDAVQITIKELPESADDNIETEFLSKQGCKIVGKVMKRMIRYNNQLTNCSNGDRMAYIKAVPPKPIPRSVKIGPHWVKVFYYGQAPAKRQHRDKETEDAASSPQYSPTTEHSFKIIRETYERYVEKPPSSSEHATKSAEMKTVDSVTENIISHATGSAEPEAVESEMENITSRTTESAVPKAVDSEMESSISLSSEEKGDESGDVSVEDLTAATNTVKKKKNKHKKRKKEIKEEMEKNENTRIQRAKEKSKDTTTMNRGRSNSLGSLTNVDTSSIKSYFQTVSLLKTKRPREVTSPSSESGTSSPAKKKVDTEGTGHQEAPEAPGGERGKGMDGEGARRKPGGLFP